ncbi:oxidoreductase [Oerskovia flava]|uniref:oxidoreductase n=1 Tax=Oerskovia flava TaxID=2986422 RepID=UPI0022405642|nr:oxidoreductase [Oerskovia sp. JB1-3-2]
MSRLSQLFSRRPSGQATTPGEPDGSRRAVVEHLAEFARTRVGVEAYIEPATHDTPTTLILIATTGEWTRRRVPDARTARKVAEQLELPVYDVNFTGYPQRMRDWNSRHKRRR